MGRKFWIYSTPILGDYLIHKFFSEQRGIAKGKIQDFKDQSDDLEERLEGFQTAFAELKAKYDIREIPGSAVSYPSNFITKERARLSDGTLWLSTHIPETIIFFSKYLLTYIGSRFVYELVSNITEWSNRGL